MRVYVGYDPRDEMAFRACVSSMRKHSSIPLEIYPLRDYDLRRRGFYTRAYYVESSGQMIDAWDQKPFSTQFSFTRFSIPLFDKTKNWVVFCDADFLFRDDIAKLFAHADDTKKLMCVQHNYKPSETTKFDGMRQEQYNRKNWSSLMLMRPGLCDIDKCKVNTFSGSYLHQFQWLKDEDIGSLPVEWNWLEGWSDPVIKPSAVHYTRGTPDMLGALPFASEWWPAARAWKPEMNFHELPACV